jgi:acyl CoA:acetate/3-ketoacid CoA transferase
MDRPAQVTRRVPAFESPDQAVSRIPPEATVMVGSCGGGIMEPGAVLAALERRFVATGAPRDLTLYIVSGMGDRQGGGADRFAHPGMVRRVYGSHWGWSPALAAMVMSGDIEAYVLPQGVMSQLLREIAARRPGVITHVGRGTFVDPRLEGARANDVTPAGYVQLIELGGREWLFYPAIPIDVAIIRATTSDEHGNLTMEHEGMTLEALAAAQAAHNSGGQVIAQVKRLAAANSLDARNVRVPGILVDAVVVVPDQAQSMHCFYDPAFSGELRLPNRSLPTMAWDARKLVARRAALELRKDAIVNVGYGIADGVAAVAAEEGIFAGVTFTVEQGMVGGLPATGDQFGLAANQDAIVDQPYQFDFYDGGGLDLTFLSFAEIDALGNVNVSRFGGRLVGCGGFVNMSQSAKKVVFCGTFTSGGLDVAVVEGQVRIRREGRYRKLVRRAEQITFAARGAWEHGHQVLYVTERAVFELDGQGLVLTETAPGIDLGRDIMEQAGCAVRISPDLREMDPAIFRPEPMGLAGRPGWKSGACAS